MSKIIYTCNNCGFDNPEDSSKCNKCGISLVVVVRGGLFSSDTYRNNYTKRWICARCGAKNVDGNNKCHGCSSQSNAGSFDLF
jgi:ribosomal protein L40E